MKALLLHALVAASILLALAGCSAERRVEKALAKAQLLADKGEYEDAKKILLILNADDIENTDALRGLAAIYQARGQWRLAYFALKRIEELKDLSPADQLELAALQQTIGQLQAARENALAAYAADPSLSQSLIVFAKALDQNQTIAEGLAFLDQLQVPPAQKAPHQIARSIALARQRNLRAAEFALAQAFVAEPKNSQAHLALARLRLQQNNIPAAEQAFRQAAALAPARSTATLELAAFKRRTGHFEEAQSILEAFSRSTPDYLPGLLDLADIYLAQKRLEDGEQLVAAAIAIERDNPGALLTSGRLKIAAGNLEDAAAILSNMVRLYPNSYPAHLQLGIATLGLGRSRESMQHLETARRLAPQSTEANMLLAQIDAGQADLDGALIRLREYLASDPNNREAKLFLAETHRAKNQPAQAIALYQELLLNEPKNADLIHRIGLLHQLEGRAELAEQAFAQAAEADPRYFPAFEQLARLATERQQHERAHQILADFAARNDPTDSFHQVSGIVYSGQGRLGAAETSLENAIQANPQNIESYLLLAQILRNSGRETQAAERLQAAVAAVPSSIDARLLLSSVLDQLGRYEEAAAQLRQVIDLEPEQKTALSNLAYLLAERLGHLPQAFEVASQARRLYPGDPYIADTLGRVLFRQGNYLWAESLAAEAAIILPDNAHVQRHLGLAHYMMGEEKRAADTLGRALALGLPSDAAQDSHRRIDVLEVPPNAGPEGIAFLEAHLAQDPQDTMAQLKLAQIHDRLGQSAPARDALLRILAATPDHPPALALLASIEAREGNPARAFEMAQKAYALNENHPQILGTLGQLAYEMRQPERAFDALRRSLRAAPNPSYAYTLAKSAFALGLLDEAKTRLADSPFPAPSTGTTSATRPSGGVGAEYIIRLWGQSR